MAENISLIESELGMRRTNNFGKYLGVPIISDGRDKRAFDYVIEKVMSKLSS